MWINSKASCIIDPKQVVVIHPTDGDVCSLENQLKCLS
jgi:hypothetical protein